MNLSRLFIYRPIATLLLMIALVVAGALGYRYLSISALPEVDYPVIQVTTQFRVPVLRCDLRCHRAA